MYTALRNSMIQSICSSSLRRLLLHAGMMGAATVASVLLGVVPNVIETSATQAELDFGTTAYAQAVSDQEVQNYARSVLAIEPIRQDIYNRIKNRIGSVPEIACHRPSSLSELDARIRQDAIDYCNRAIAIVERNNLTILRFNAITIAHQSDADLSNRIRQAMMRLQ